MARAWILQANPKKWDVWAWWEDEAGELDSWTIARHLSDIQVGDDFALWISGANAGVYAIGTIVGPPEGPYREEGGYWVDPPSIDTWSVGIEVTRYLFEDPLLKTDLMADANFASALIIRMAARANPIPLEDLEWRAIKNLIGPVGRATKPSSQNPVITARPLGETPEDITVPTPAQEQKRTFREARLVKGYERFLGRPLMARSIRLPSGERLVCDAFDSQVNLLIEAKASASRQDVRMAIGQLFDYQRHLAKGAGLAVLVPSRPSEDVLALLRSLQVGALIQNGKDYLMI